MSKAIFNSHLLTQITLNFSIPINGSKLDGLKRNIGEKSVRACSSYDSTVICHDLARSFSFSQEMRKWRRPCKFSAQSAQQFGGHFWKTRTSPNVTGICVVSGHGKAWERCFHAPNSPLEFSGAETHFLTSSKRGVCSLDLGGAMPNSPQVWATHTPNKQASTSFDLIASYSE